jgi:2-desacetyl-2-hydroxyethyl bacteriochlorophyllide A dehydrogenase
MTAAARTTPAVLLVGPRQVEVRDVAVPEPAADEVLVRALATGISAGTELNVYRGAAPQWRGRRDPETRLFDPLAEPDWRYPFAYGYACVGRVERAGAAVTDRRPGDLVFAAAPHRLLSVVKVARTVRLPDLERPDLAAMLTSVNTAYNGVLDARPPLGAAVVVFGLGIVGQLVTRLLARTGPRHLVAVDGIARRRELARRGGATAALDPERDRVAEAVRELTGGRGADVAVDASGAPAALGEAIRTVGLEGQVVALSWYGGSFAGLDLMSEFHHNRVRIRSSQVGAVDPALGPLWSVERRMGLTLEALTALDLEALVSHRVPMAEAPAMFRLLDTEPAQVMQVILTYPEPT